MPVWRCPHCGTPQAETSRCWVCGRSTTSCATCRHFRRGIAGGLGLCGLDPRHPALQGTEMRACWVSRDTTAEAVARDARAGMPAPVPSADDDGRPHSRTFVPVDEPVRRPARRPAPVIATARPDPAAEPGGWSLWGDPEG
ncbi:MAG: hypothetical protein AB1627_09745 [Chloroflexota bacterium]